MSHCGRQAYFLIFCLFLICSLFHCAAGADSTYKNKWALLVGIDDYQDQNLNDLKGPVKDVYNVQSVLINNCGVPNENIDTLTDCQATKANIRNAIYQLSLKASPDDLVIFFFSGHGGPMSQDFFAVDENDGVDELITAYDTTVYSINTISDDELQTWFYNVQSRNSVLIINSCFSGGIAKSGAPGTMDSASRLNETKGDVLKDFQRDINTAKYLVLMASSDDEYSWTSQEGSIFPHFLVEGLQSSSADTDHDNWISFEEAFSYAGPRTTAVKPIQHPTYYDGNPYAEIEMVSLVSPTPTGGAGEDPSYENKWAILVGINQYLYDTNLNQAVNDANDMQDLLVNKCLFPADQVIKLTDTQATKSAVKTAIKNLESHVNSNSVVVFYFSGHGNGVMPDTNGDEKDNYDEYIAVYESDGIDWTKCISDDELYSWLNALKSYRIIGIFDSCHSGGIVKGKSDDQTPHSSGQKDGFAEDFVRELPKDDWSGGKFLMLMASDENEGSWDSSLLQNGVFTHFLLEGFSKIETDKNLNSWISAEEAFAYAKPAAINYQIQRNLQVAHPQIFDADSSKQIDLRPIGTTPTPTITPTPTPTTSSQYEFQQQWGIRGSGEGQFDNPSDVSVHSINDVVYVTDTKNHRVQVFSKTGSFLTSWGSYGMREVQFQYPNGIALNDKSGRIYVSEKEGDRIQVFTDDGDYDTYWGNDYWFLNMGGISIDRTTGEVYVADTGHNRVQVFNHDGDFLREWGSLGYGDGQFQSPVDVAFDQDTRKVYVSDQENNRVQVFNEKGWFITQFGTYGAKNGQLNGPKGLALNASGYVFVVDQGNNRVQVFSPDGDYITGWGAPGSGINQFNTPCGIDVDSATGFVYVADSNNHRVQVFKPHHPVTPSPTPTTTTPLPTPTPTTAIPTPTEPGSPLQADFSASHTSGVAPLTVRFQDTSRGNPTGWMWDVNGDGFKDYSETSCEHTYTSPGHYTVTFSITRDQELVTVSRPDYIHVRSGTPATDTMTLGLYSGWNFISTPGTLAEGHGKVSEVFSGINTAGHSTFEYNAQTHSWIQLNPNDEVEPLKGIWIYSATPAEATLVFSDEQASPNSLLGTGWNAIGFSQEEPVSAKDALSSVHSSWSHLIGFDAESQFYENSIINGGSGTHSDTNLVYPGKGYWVFMNSQGTLR
ncbi:MAG: Caspase domain protein [Methanoregulaceae archaeon PtaB.Bin009]|nr:MAG: Caspase domain protein [Methanoregulaceae archaeon PtaB.Bin009]